MWGLVKINRFVVWQVSPNHKLLAVTEDFTGDEVYTIRVIDIGTGQSVGKPITGVSERIEWLKDNETLIYVTQDEVHRPYKVCKFHSFSYSRAIEAWLEVE
jgi:oligopeptidase B